ncbi:MAG TPA: RNA polymerase sigma factor [Cytophagales bacterium]|nr:RNA polymerase sigma factor [Cytophagales bacterium]
MTRIDFNSQLCKASKMLKPFALKFTKDLDDANDLIQDTLVKALTNQDKFANGTNLTAWLFTIMRNTFITNYQKAVRRNTFVDTTDTLFHINTEDYRAENAASGSFAGDDIQRALSQLSEPVRVCFMMYFNGYKYEEIAEKLNAPLGTVKNRIHIARKELQEQLKMYKDQDLSL